MAGKWVEILKEISPTIRHVGVIFDPRITANVTYLRIAETAAAKHDIMVSAGPTKDATEIETTIRAFGRTPNSGLIVLPNPMTGFHRERISELAIYHRLPSASTFRYMVEGGILVSYGAHSADLYRRAADFVDRILKGTRPADIPVETPTRFEMFVNLKTAKALGLIVPPTVLGLADEVIE
jgi:putative ABC transport system substrate-binding protein